jgi:carbon-monoxide dehydrogenase small subunit
VVDDRERLDALIASNLCRCTGYEGIRRAARRAAGRDPDGPRRG